MKKRQKYVVQCCKPVWFCGVNYRKGDYVTGDGSTTRKLSDAYVYRVGSQYDDFFDEEASEEARMHFKPRAVALKLVLVEEEKTHKERKADMVALRKKAYHPSSLTDRELAQLRRSSGTGADLLWKVYNEQRRRGLLFTPHRCGSDAYPAEKLKRISDYPEDQKSPRRRRRNNHNATKANQSDGQGP